MAYTIAEIEDAIVNALRASSLGDIAKTIDSYHGEIDDIIEDFRKMTAPLPAVYVLYAGSVFEESANRSYDDEQTYTVVIIARDLRGNESLRDGMYQMIEAAKDALIDNDLGLDIEPLHPLRVEATVITKIFSIYSLDLKTSFSI